jgi:phosphoenolpyruvate carboxykinase (GTP)
MAMLPFCGYHMADYWRHWLTMGARPGARMPRVYYVNWFRKDADGRFLWPGFGENSRVLAWIFRRGEGTAEAVETEIGNLPTESSLELDGLDLSADSVRALLGVDVDGWLREVDLMRAHYARFGDRLPPQLRQELDGLEARLRAASAGDA